MDDIFYVNGTMASSRFTKLVFRYNVSVMGNSETHRRIRRHASSRAALCWSCLEGWSLTVSNLGGYPLSERWVSIHAADDSVAVLQAYICAGSSRISSKLTQLRSGSLRVRSSRLTRPDKDGCSPIVFSLLLLSSAFFSFKTHQGPLPKVHTGMSSIISDVHPHPGKTPINSPGDLDEPSPAAW